MGKCSSICCLEICASERLCSGSRERIDVKVAIIHRESLRTNGLLVKGSVRAIFNSPTSPTKRGKERAGEERGHW